MPVGGLSILPVHKPRGRWHHVVGAAQGEVLGYIENVINEFKIPGHRTNGCLIQDWAVNLAWSGADELARSGMMDTQRRNADNERLESSGTYDADKVQRLNSNAANVNRQMQRRIA